MEQTDGRSKDLGRVIDYLETRTDIDASKLAFVGNSLGSAMSPRLIAVEPRFKAAVLFSVGTFRKLLPKWMRGISRHA